MRVSTGTRGTVIDVQVFTRDGVEKDQRALDIENSQLDKFRKDLKDEYRILLGATYERLTAALDGQAIVSAPGLKKGDTLSQDYLAALEASDWFKIRLADDDLNELLEKAEASLEERKKD